MILRLTPDVIKEIHAHGEATYPDEGAGLLLGKANGDLKLATAVLKLANTREDSARHNRFLLTPQDYFRGEQEAARLDLDVIGVFHSHPDHPNRPSEFDREWAMPWFSYIITTVQDGRATESRSWQLNEDHSAFFEEQIVVQD
jgi:proteasome lid subunit RPN8/RPN11